MIRGNNFSCSEERLRKVTEKEFLTKKPFNKAFPLGSKTPNYSEYKKLFKKVSNSKLSSEEDVKK